MYLKEFFATENSWNPDLHNFSNQADPIVKKEIDYYSSILQNLKDMQPEKEGIEYVKNNPVREILVQESYNRARFKF